MVLAEPPPTWRHLVTRLERTERKQKSALSVAKEMQASQPEMRVMEMQTVVIRIFARKVAELLVPFLKDPFELKVMDLVKAKRVESLARKVCRLE